MRILSAHNIIGIILGLLTITTLVHGGAQRRGAVETMNPDNNPDFARPNNLEIKPVFSESSPLPRYRRETTDISTDPMETTTPESNDGWLSIEANDDPVVTDDQNDAINTQEISFPKSDNGWMGFVENPDNDDDDTSTDSRRKRHDLMYHNIDSTLHSKRNVQVNDNSTTVSCGKTPKDFPEILGPIKLLKVGKIITVKTNSIISRIARFKGDEMKVRYKELTLCRLSKLMKRTRHLRNASGEDEEIDVSSISSREKRVYKDDEAEFLWTTRTELLEYYSKLFQTVEAVKEMKNINNRNECTSLRGSDSKPVRMSGRDEILLCNMEDMVGWILSLLVRLENEILKSRMNVLTEADFFIACFKSLKEILKLSSKMNAEIVNIYLSILKNKSRVSSLRNEILR